MTKLKLDSSGVINTQSKIRYIKSPKREDTPIEDILVATVTTVVAEKALELSLDLVKSIFESKPKQKEVVLDEKEFSSKKEPNAIPVKDNKIKKKKVKE